jgi:TrwC relaxase
VLGLSRDVGDVLSIGRLGGSGRSERYYTQAVATGREDYYAGRGEAPGTWLGSGAAAIDADGIVKPEDLTALFKGQDPVSGKQLRRPPAEGEVSAFDLTFRAPKSVSILFGIGASEVASKIRSAHDAAVADALGYLERHACQTMRGGGGRVRLAGEGFVAAASTEIRRLQERKPSSRVERFLDRRDVARDIQTGNGDAVRFRDDEAGLRVQRPLAGEGDAR